MKPNWKHISRSCSRILRLASEPWRRIRNWRRLRAWRLKAEAERATAKADFDSLEAEKRDRERERKARDRYRRAGMSKQQRALSERWIKTPFGKI